MRMNLVFFFFAFTRSSLMPKGALWMLTKVEYTSQKKNTSGERFVTTTI